MSRISKICLKSEEVGGKEAPCRLPIVVPMLLQSLFTFLSKLLPCQKTDLILFSYRPAPKLRHYIVLLDSDRYYLSELQYLEVGLRNHF